ncbi:MAG: hypothetical protein U0324_46320 [Polyangiales bacterium]
MALSLPSNIRGPVSADARNGRVRWIAHNPITGRYKLCSVGARKLLTDTEATLGRPDGGSWSRATLTALKDRVTREAGPQAGAMISDTATSLTRAALRAAVWLCYEQRSGDIVPGGTPEARIWLLDDLRLPALGAALSDTSGVSCAAAEAIVDTRQVNTTGGGNNTGGNNTGGNNTGGNNTGGNTGGNTSGGNTGGGNTSGGNTSGGNTSGGNTNTGNTGGGVTRATVLGVPLVVGVVGAVALMGGAVWLKYQDGRAPLAMPSGPRVPPRPPRPPAPAAAPPGPRRRPSEGGGVPRSVTEARGLLAWA